MKKTVDGNTACSEIAYLFSEVATIYPITPSSPMADHVDAMSAGENYNLFNDKVHVTEMESEAGAAGAMHGALVTGSLATTFTASQGLLLMIPNMYKMAGECLPGVIHCAARTVATHALSIFGDHGDVYATRQTGFCMLASSSVQDAHNLAAVAHLSAIEGSLPFLHFFDGFRTSHEINVIETLNNNELLKLVNKDALKSFKERSLNLGVKKQMGMAENEDVYFQSVEARQELYDKIPDIVNKYMMAINKIAKTKYKPFNYYGAKDATEVIVAMGSVNDTARLVVDDLNRNGRRVGLIEVHLYRPFSAKYFLKALPETVKKIAVLDRTKESGSIGEPLYLDVLGVLKNSKIKVVGGRYGLSSKNTTPAQIKAVYDMLKGNNLKESFTIGIVDDITHSSLEVDESYTVDLKTLEMQIYGFGSDGMVSASKDIIHLVGDAGNYVQSYNEYDSKKSGGVTIAHLRFGQSPIRAPYYVTNANIVVVTKDEYFRMYEMLNKIKKNGFLLINTTNKEECINKMTKKDLDIISSRNITILTINAERIAEEHGIKGKISKIMEVVILNLLCRLNKKSLAGEDPINLLNKSIKDAFQAKGEDIVKNNQDAIKEALDSVERIIVKDSLNKDLKEVPLSIFERMNKRLGDSLTVSEVKSLRSGAFEGDLTSKEKRGVSSKVPKWNKDNCIQCGMCSLVCPHAVIRPFLVEGEGNDGIEAMGAKGYRYIISISEKDCLGCGLCASICPGKAGVKALTMGDATYENQDECNKLFKNHENPKLFNKFTIKGSQFEKPKFEFSGACAGCGEAAYTKLMTQLFGDEIIYANATGCSSIYGGSAPSTPYSIPWANSLFEDNAEFGYGMHLSFKNKRSQLKNAILANMNNFNETAKPLMKELLDNFEDNAKTKEIYDKLAKVKLPKRVADLKEYIKNRTIICQGGDGWAYDIGFNGIDHVLSSEENIKVMVLDTEVYSNTGGQMSKSSHIGQVAQFAGMGKKNHKKDMFRIAMSYPNCYVGTICLGANMMQAISVMKEAMEHKGPAIIICYCPCIEHGIKGGMSCSLQEEKLAVESGYVLLMRYNPVTNLIKMDSKMPDFEKYDDFLSNEVRYRSLKLKNKEAADELLEANKEAAINRYKYYEELISHQRNENIQETKA